MARRLETLQDLYLDELRDLFNAEMQLVKALPQMARAAQSDDLRRAFQEDVGRTQSHVQRLKQIFKACSAEPEGHQCKGMEGLLREGLDLIEDGSQTPVRDAGLIVTAQKAQHYEIAGYGSASAFARILGRNQDENLLQQTMDEEKEADRAFTEIATHAINLAAAANA